MKKLPRFILKSFVGPFLAILLVVIFILMMQFLWLYIDELVGKGLGFKVVAEFLFWGGCTILPLALPLSTLLASVMTIGSMGENNELMAMKSSGISMLRVLAPVGLASVVISVAAFFAANDLVPEAYNQIFILRDDIGRTKEEIKIPVGTFYDGIEGYVLRVDGRDEESGMMHGVLVYDHTGGKGNTSLIVADSAMLKMSKAKDYLTFTLYNGSNYQETNVKKYRDTTLSLQKVSFAQEGIIIPLENYAFQKNDDGRFNDQVKTMDLRHQRIVRDSILVKRDSIITAHMSEMYTSSTLRYLRQLDTAFSVKDIKGDLQPEGLFEWKDDDEELAAYDHALSSLEHLDNIITGYGYDAFEYTRVLRLSQVEILHKFAQALSCFILFFIGAPLGVIIRKGGLGTSAIVAVLFFVLYWVVDITGSKLGRDGAISPLAGAFASTAVMLPLGIFITYKAVNDATFFTSDSLGVWWRKLKSKVMSVFRKTRIVYMGTPEFAVAPLDALVKGGYNVVGVVTVADKPSGRGLKLNESPVKKYAVEAGIPVLQPEKLKDPVFLEQLSGLKADLFVVVGFRMLPEAVWAMPKLGTFNLHAALLPQYRGAAPINWAVINGERMTGVTTFMIDKDIDTGGIIFRSESRISDTDTAGDVHDALMSIGSSLVVDTVQAIIEKNVETRVQRSFIQGSELLKPAPKLTRELQHIDWRDTTENVYNLIRGLSPFPCAFTELCREGEAPVQLKVYFGERRHDLHAAPGTVLSDGKTYFAVATLDGAIALTDLQLSGKKRMDVKAFLAGFRDPESWGTTAGTSRSVIESTVPKPEE